MSQIEGDFIKRKVSIPNNITKNFLLVIHKNKNTKEDQFNKISHLNTS